jgi:hypothetical protein
MKFVGYFVFWFFTYYGQFIVDGQQTADFESPTEIQKRLLSRGMERMFREVMMNFSASLERVAQDIDRMNTKLLQLEKNALSSRRRT